MSTDETHSPCLTTSPEDSASYHTCWIGKPIHEALQAATTTVVRGTTSRGIFLEINTGWIAFLSSEQFRGPLTLNFDKPFSDVDRLTPGLIGRISNGMISFDQLQIKLETSQTAIWSSLWLFSKINNDNILATRNFEIKNFAKNLRTILETPNEYLEFAHNRLFDPKIQPASPLEEYLSELIKGIQTNNANLIDAPLQYIAGRGRGLTPSGDDFLAGLLLGLYLSKQSPQSIRLPIRQKILDTIRSRSTLISANLAECAAVGEVDERIATSVDYLLEGNFSEVIAQQSILDWGSSSGVDTIAGFISALTI